MTLRLGSGASGPGPILPARARTILARLELISNAKAQDLNREGGRSVDRPAGPSGPRMDEANLLDDSYPHIFWRRRMLQALVKPDGGVEFAEVMEGAEDALQRLLKAPEAGELVPEARKDMEKRALTQGEGFPVHLVLVNFPDLTHKQLVSLRAGDGRSVETGYRLREVAEETKEQRLERALQMRARGCSYGQVHQDTGLAKATVWRAERKAAA